MSFVTAATDTRARFEPVIGGDPIAVPVRAETPVELTQPADSAVGEAVAQSSDADAEREAALSEAYAQAERNGYAEGLQRGREEGLAQERREIESRTRVARTDLDALIGALTDPWRVLRGDVADAIVEAAVHLAQVVVGSLPSVDAKALRRVVEEILEEVSEMDGAGHTVRFRVHPSKLAAVERWTEQAKAEAIADERLGPADVRAEWVRKDGDPMNRIDWDATLEGRWRAVRRAIGLAESES